MALLQQSSRLLQRSSSRTRKKVLVVDRHRGAGQGSTSYSSGICRMHYSILDSVKFSWEGYHYWKHWKGHIGYARLRECGSLIFKTKVGIPYEMWDRQSVPVKERGSPHYYVWAAMIQSLQQDAATPPAAAATLQAYAEQASARGFDLRDFSPAKREELSIDHHQFGEASDDLVEGALFAPITGYISDPVLATLLATLNMQLAAEATGNFVHDRRLTDLGATQPVTAMAFEGLDPAFVATRSVEPECDFPLEFVEDPDTGNPSLTDSHTNYEAYRAALRMPGLALPSAADTQVPIYDRSLIPGYFMAIGTSGNQFKNAGVAGNLMAEIIVRCEAVPWHPSPCLLGLGLVASAVVGVGRRVPRAALGSLPRRNLAQVLPAAALAAASAVLPAAASAADGERLMLDGMEEFQRGNVAESIALFDKSAEAGYPKARLWQRGLSLYYVERFADGADQFRKDVEMNPNDTEESIWAMLCEAKTLGFDEARKRILKVGRDRRPYMRTAYALFAGEDEPASLAALQKLSESKGTNDEFYSALYLGLFAEAKGDVQEAKRWLTRAATSGYANGSGDYMAKLAQVHVKLRSWSGGECKIGTQSVPCSI
ncbi:unnamed protein product [Polarella glacialis]|uniref:FAD dependent oxidoreductase domain-containing protein n=1 Tax=Polarella glacialis TaxID=89957 RepID=A0A813F8W1_POLGL|nr:unnamed protein product [Polarella glacialis]